MKLSDLLATIQPVRIAGSTNMEITGVNIDSRLIETGHLFMAMRGTQTDGHAYIPAAIDKGAVAVLCEELPEELKTGTTYILVKDSEDAEYLLSYLPRIRQETFTVGAAWRHYAGRHVQTVSLGHTYLNNRNLKYRGNDDSSEDNLTLRLRSVEQKTTLRAENRSYLGRWTVREGAELSYSGYTNRTEQRLFTDEAVLSDYRTRLGIVGWGLFAGADYASADKRFTASVGVRADGADYSARMAKFWRQLSPRASVSYQLGKGWSLSGSAGLYYQLPPYTALGFKQDGALVNEALDYLRVGMISVGGGWRLRDRLVVSVEGEKYCRPLIRL